MRLLILGLKPQFGCRDYFKKVVKQVLYFYGTPKTWYLVRNKPPLLSLYSFNLVPFFRGNHSCQLLGLYTHTQHVQGHPHDTYIYIFIHIFYTSGSTLYTLFCSLLFSFDNLSLQFFSIRTDNCQHFL